MMERLHRMQRRLKHFEATGPPTPKNCILGGIGLKLKPMIIGPTHVHCATRPMLRSKLGSWPAGPGSATWEFPKIRGP